MGFLPFNDSLTVLEFYDQFCFSSDWYLFDLFGKEQTFWFQVAQGKENHDHKELNLVSG